ncbi:MAG: hypothetical protein IIT79_02690, partial [Aeriscardovia sp.]|nr:hypothetical protein [Aeriscardovia sp.]
MQQEGYYVSTFTATLGSYSAPETFTSYIDPDGFINVSKDTVVINPVLPNTYFLYSDGKAAYSASTGNTPSLSQTVGSANVFDYQLSTYLSYGPMQFFFPTYQGYQLNFPDATIAGIPFSVLKEHGASLTGPSDAYNGIDLSAEAISYIEENGYLPATPTQPGHTSKIILATGLSNRTLSVTIPTYLTSQFTAGNQVGVNINYSGTSKLGGQSITQGYYPSATTNGSADDSVPSSLTAGSTPSSSSGLWFKDLQADGQPSSGAKFVVQDSSGRYLVKEIDSYGRFSGWGWTAASASATEFSQENDSALFSMGGLKDGTYTVTQIQWPDSMTGSSGLANGNNWPSPDLSAGSKTAAPPSFEVTLSYSSPEAMSTQADPAGTVDAKDDWIYSLSPIEMAPMDGSSLSSQTYQTETVGVPFTEGWEGYLPIASVSPDKASPAGLDSALKITLPEVSSSTPCGADDSIQVSQIDIAGISMETLEKNTKSTFSSRSSLVSIYLPYSALEYLEENGKNASGQALSSSSDRRIIVTFPAEITEGFKDGSVLHQGMGLGSNWWMQDASHFTSSSPLYTNGPADNSLPSSLSMSSSSGSTGLWFKSLWWGRNTPAQGAKFTVSQTQGGKT